MNTTTKTIGIILKQIQFTLRQHILAVRFIRKNELWKGFWQYGWVSRILVVLGVLLGMKVVSLYMGWLGETLNISVFNSMSMMSGVIWDTFMGDFFNGGFKYVIMILLEIVIFHVSRKSVHHLTGVYEEASFNNFFKAQIRMVKVSFRSWILETIIVKLIGVAFSIFGFLTFMESSLVFGVSCFYLGFGLIDNYNEQFGLSISESVKYARRFIGVGIAGGLVLQLFFLIPVVGAIVGPFVGAVAIVLAMYKLSDLHIKSKEEILNEMA